MSTYNYDKQERNKNILGHLKKEIFKNQHQTKTITHLK